MLHDDIDIVCYTTIILRRMSDIDLVCLLAINGHFICLLREWSDHSYNFFTLQHGSNRSFVDRYFRDKQHHTRNWHAYSPKLDGAFCVPCALFVDARIRPQLKGLVNEPIRSWARAPTMLEGHSGLPYHITAVESSKTFIQTIDNLAAKITNQLSTIRQRNIEENREIMEDIIPVVLFLTRQGLAFRGHDESKESRNKGNFKELLELLSLYSPRLKHHIETNSSVHVGDITKPVP